MTTRTRDFGFVGALRLAAVLLVTGCVPSCGGEPSDEPHRPVRLEPGLGGGEAEEPAPSSTDDVVLPPPSDESLADPPPVEPPPLEGGH